MRRTIFWEPWAAQAERTGNDCVIATGDRDSLQLVSPAVTVRLAATKMGRPEVTLYDEAKIMEVYGVTPKELIEIKAIQGDSSDCIPGVKGIGQKGAAELIQRYHSVQYLYDHIDELEIKEGLRTKLKAGRKAPGSAGCWEPSAPMPRWISIWRITGWGRATGRKLCG